MKKHILLASGALTLAAPITSVAQTSGSDTAGLEDIVVTAQRVETRLQDTPIAITALTAAAITDQQILSTQDVAKGVPGLILNPVTANPSTFQIGLRGGSEQTGGLIVSEPVVGIYVDDVYRGRLQGSNFQLSDIERIEVLRGPQGTLYGRNTFSGAVKIVTRTPGINNEWLQASVGVGSFDEFRAEASVGRALTDTLGVSLSVFYRDQNDGWVFNRALGEDIGKERNIALRGKMAYDDGPLRITAALAYTDDKNDGYFATNVVFNPDAGRTNFATRVFTDDAEPLLGGDPYVVATPTVSAGKTSVLSASLDIAYDFEGFTLRSISGFVDTEDLFRWDLAGGLEIAPGSFISTFDRLSNSDAQQFSQELQATGTSFDDRLRWIAGVFYFNEDGTQDFTDTIGLFFLPTFPLFTQETKTQSIAGFAEATWNLTDATAVTIGARYTSDDKEFDATIAAPANVAVAIDETFNSFTPKFGIEHKFSDDVLAYASISRGFKAGGFNGLSRDPRVLALTYRPQKVWAYEAGLKSELFDRRVRANLAFFYNDITDLQQTASRPDGTFPLQNVGDARIWGIEAEINAQPVRGLTLSASGSYNNDKFKSLAPESDAFLAGAQNLPLVSEWMARLGGTYEHPLGDVLQGRIGGNLSYTGAFDATVTNVLLVNGYTRIDAFIALGSQDGRWEVNLSGQNLTDGTHYVSGIVTAPFPPALTTLKPRTWLASLKVNY